MVVLGLVKYWVKVPLIPEVCHVPPEGTGTFQLRSISLNHGDAYASHDIIGTNH